MSKKPAKGAAPAAVRVRLNQRVVLAVVLVPLILAGLWMFFAAPARVDAADAAKAHADAAQQTQTVQDQIRGLQTGQTPRSQSLLRQAVALDGLLPAVNDPIALGTSLTSYAATTGVQIASFSRGETYPLGPSQAQAYQVAATGTREQLSTFLDGVSHYPQLLTVPTLTVGPSSASAAATSHAPGAAAATPTGPLTATFTLLAWSSSTPALNVTSPGEAPVTPGDASTLQRPSAPTG